MANTRECWICGKQYEYCYKCDKVNSWKLSACSRVHFQINTILNEYRGKVLTILEAKEKFNNIGIVTEDELIDLLPAVKADVMKIINHSGTIEPVSNEVLPIEKEMIKSVKQIKQHKTKDTNK